ncbi:hypothetical protein [Streptomyces sp. NPDC020996]|uniref:hypothetical protein n=1 Tax=Streptomyces sp. NPDC020996 TaxID=3154791 RepID=UPI00340CDA7A
MRWLAGMTMTADRLNDNTLDDSTTTGLAAAAGFSVSSFSGRKLHGITTIQLVCTYTGTTVAITPGANLADVLMCTLPSGWRPPEVINAVFGDGSIDGECTIGTSGQISLRSILDDLTNNRNIRVTAMWISENN